MKLPTTGRIFFYGCSALQKKLSKVVTNYFVWAASPVKA